jgi:hypothetical protein
MYKLLRILVFFVLLFGLTGLGLRAQWRAGLEGGPDFNSIQTNISNVPMTEYAAVSGYQVGIPMQYRINDYLSLEAVPTLLQKSYKLVWKGTLDSNFVRSRNTYLQLPLLVDLSYGWHGFHLTGQFGAYSARWLHGRVQGSLPNLFTLANGPFDSALVFNGKRDQRWEIGWVAGGRLAYNFQETWQLFLCGRYYQSLTNEQKNEYLGQIPRYNRTWGVSVGALFKLTRK